MGRSRCQDRELYRGRDRTAWVKKMEEHNTGPEITGTGIPTGRGAYLAEEGIDRVTDGQVPEEILLYIGSYAEGAFYCSWNGKDLAFEAPACCDRDGVPAETPPGPLLFSRLHEDLDTLGVWSGPPGERACGCAGVVHYLFRIRWGERNADWRGSFDPAADPHTGEWLTQIQNALLRLASACPQETVSPGNLDLGEDYQEAR